MNFKIGSRKINYVLVQNIKNIVLIVTFLIVAASYKSEQFGQLLLALSVSAFYQSFVETYFSEVYTSTYKHRKEEYLNAFFVWSLIFWILLLLLPLYILKVFFNIQYIEDYYYYILGNTLFCVSYLLLRAKLVLTSELYILTSINIFEVIVFTIQILMALNSFPFKYIVIAYFVRLPITNILCIIKLNKFKKEFNDFKSHFNICRILLFNRNAPKLLINLIIKSFNGTQDLMIINYQFGASFVVLYKFMMQIKTGVSSLSSAIWHSNVGSFLKDNKINYIKLKYYVMQYIKTTLSIAFASIIVIGLFLSLIGNYLITEINNTDIEILKMFITHKTEFIVFCIFYLLPYTLSQWTRIVLLIEEKIEISTITHIILLIGIFITAFMASNFLTFLIGFGLITSIASIMLIIEAYRILKLKAMPFKTVKKLGK
jgi:hypothetical protein